MVKAGAGTDAVIDELTRVFEPGDIIVAVDNVPISSRSQFLNIIGMARLRHDLAVTFDRGGNQSTIAITVAPQPGSDAAEQSSQQ